MTHWPVVKLPLSPPPLEALATIVRAGLSKNFSHVSVEVGDCPDLREEPYCLAAAGLCGNERIADIGGPSNLAPTPKLDRKYSLIDMATLIEMDPEKGFLLGASAGPFHILGVNSELAPNLSYTSSTQITNKTHYTKITASGSPICAPITSTDFGLMANLFSSTGLPGPVLKVTAKTRTGPLNFTACIQEALKAEYGEKTVSLGGVFVIRKGKARVHVMPGFSEVPLRGREEVEGWLRYFEMGAPLVCLSVFHSFDPGLGLRMEHTHCFSGHGEGGHYHGDVTPEEVEYEAYFNVAKVLYRIDG